MTRLARDLGDDPGFAACRHGRDRDRASQQGDRLLARGCASHLSERPEHMRRSRGVDFAEVCITSDIAIETRAGRFPKAPFGCQKRRTSPLSSNARSGVKCARSWRYFDPATASPDFPDVTPRDAEALCASSRRLAACHEAAGLGALSAPVVLVDQVAKIARPFPFRPSRTADSTPLDAFPRS